MVFLPGHIDTVLSDEGIKQAELVAERLQDEKFTHAFSSDLQRAYKVGQVYTPSHSKSHVLMSLYFD